MTARRSVLRAALLAAAVGAAGLWSCAGLPRPAGPGAVSGRVTFRGEPVAGAVVTFYDRYAQSDMHAATAVRCDGEGAFAARMPPGVYIVEAEGTVEGKEVFAFSGQNPVNVGAARRWLGMKAVARQLPESFPRADGAGAAVDGEVFHRDAPVEDAYVYVYASPKGDFKGMGIAMSPPTGADGTFSVENLPESSYFLVARRRGAGGTTGPLEKGDLYGFYPGNPVYARAERTTRVRIEMVDKEKPLSYAEVTSGTEIVLRGRVLDRAGEPQAGVYAFVYDDRVFGHQRPYAHSGRTGADGAFAIYLDRPGVYYLGARENFGNSPRPGERVGFYEGTPDHAVVAAGGKTLEGLPIVVDRILVEDRR